MSWQPPLRVCAFKYAKRDEYNAETHDEMYATRFVKVLHKGVTCFEM